MVCVVRERSVRRVDHSSRRVLPIVVCLSVILKSQKREGLGPLGVLSPKSKLQCTFYSCNYSGSLSFKCQSWDLALLSLISSSQSSKFWISLLHAFRRYFFPYFFQFLTYLFIYLLTYLPWSLLGYTKINVGSDR